MQLINNQIWINLEDYLDLSAFAKIEDKINYAIAKNYDAISYGLVSRTSLLDPSRENYAELRVSLKEQHPELTQSQANMLARISGASTFGSTLSLRTVNGYPANYSMKHKKSGTSDARFSSDFKFLFDWINDQHCFSDYGRVLFFIDCPNESVPIHSDYGDIHSVKRDMFFWITSSFNPKQIFVYNQETKEKIYCPYRATIFNAANWHGAQGHPECVSWSLRVDGVFNKEWANRVGIADYYDV